MYSSSFSINFYFNILRRLSDKYWFVPLLFIVMVKLVFLLNSLKSFIVFAIIFYTIYVFITTSKGKQILTVFNWFFNLLFTQNYNFVSTNKQKNVHDEPEISNIEEKKKETHKTIIVKKKFYVNVEKKIVIRQQHNYYLVMEKNEEPNGQIETSDDHDAID